MFNKVFNLFKKKRLSNKCEDCQFFGKSEPHACYLKLYEDYFGSTNLYTKTQLKRTSEIVRDFYVLRDVFLGVRYWVCVTNKLLTEEVRMSHIKKALEKYDKI